MGECSIKCGEKGKECGCERPDRSSELRNFNSIVLAPIDSIPLFSAVRGQDGRRVSCWSPEQPQIG